MLPVYENSLLHMKNLSYFSAKKDQAISSTERNGIANPLNVKNICFLNNFIVDQMKSK